MGAGGRTLVLVGTALLAATGVHAQEHGAARRAYFEAVAGYFKLPSNEVAILADWGIDPDEIPPILFVAEYAGVSPEALVALRRAGRGWSTLIRQYGISPSALHVPVRDQAPTGVLEAAYTLYRGTPVGQWPTIQLADADVVALVNVRVIAQTLGVSAEDVIRQTDSAATFVELYSRLNR